jgi:hypothetical protein
MSINHRSILLLACAMLAGSSAFSTARAQGFGFFLPPPMYAPPPPPYYGPDFYEPYYQRAPRRYRSQRQHQAPALRRKKSVRAERKAPLRKDRQAALTVPSKAPAKATASSSGCEKAQASVAEFGFTEIKPQGCTGKTALFRAMRDGKSFDIQVQPASGELTKVQRLR